MKIVTLILTVVVFAVMTITQVQAGKPSKEEHIFLAEFSGAVTGFALSTPIVIQNNMLNVVFNKATERDIAFSSTLDWCFPYGIDRDGFTMHVLNNYLERDWVVARFWFRALDPSGAVDDSVLYALSLFDSGSDAPVWSGDFPPAQGETITRTAESWELGPTKRNVKDPCTGSGDFSPGDVVLVTLTHDDQH